MKKAIKVSIPEPCHEDWGKMSQTEKGKFCGVCTKEVVDFTKVIDEDIVKYVMKNDDACGRFSKSQLDRSLTLERSAGQRFAPLAASLLLPLTMMASAASAPKQGSIKTSSYKSLGIGSLHKNIAKTPIIVYGVITDTTGRPLSNVQVKIKETGENTFTNEYGEYKISFLNNETLLFIRDDYQFTQEQFTKGNQKFDLTLTAAIHEPMIMGEITAPELLIEEETVKGDIIEINELTFTGNITDDQYLPLPGANIIVKGTTNGTQSDFDGNYSISATANSILVISYIGFDSKEVELSKNKTINNITLDGFINGGLSVGIVIVQEETNNRYWPFSRVRRRISDPEREAEIAARKKAEANGSEFKKMKLAQKKEIRQAKRAQKKQY